MSLHSKPNISNPGATDQAAFREHAERFQTFLANTNQKARTQAAIIAGLRTLAPQVLDNLQDTQRPFDLLSIGAGNGGLGISLAAQLIGIRGTSEGFAIHCEDPAEEMESQFREKLERPDSPVPASTLSDYAVINFEDDAYKPAEADLTIASHAWYYIGNWQEKDVAVNSLVKFRQAIKPDGIGLITVQSAASDRTAIRNLYLGATGSTDKELAGEDLRDRIEELDIEVETEIINSETNVSSCFENGTFHPNEEGKRLLSFILRQNWDQLDPGVQGLIINRLSGITARNQGPHLKFIDTALWIKPIS